MKSLWKNYISFVISFTRERFDSVAIRLREIDMHPKQKIPLPAPIVTDCPYNKGILSLSATHRTLWDHSATTNTSMFVFEDDIVFDMHRASERIMSTISTSPHQFALLGYCGLRRCTHAYFVTPQGARDLVKLYRSCIESDEPTDLFCRHQGCTRAKGEILGFHGIFGQNKSLPHYIHFEPCRKIRNSNWSAHGCKSKWDYQKLGDGTVLQLRM